MIVTEGILIAATLIFLGFQIFIERDNAKKELRAYVSVEPAPIIKPDANGVIRRIPIRISAKGLTPALNLKTKFFGFSETPKEAAKQQLLFPLEETTPSDLGFIPPSSERARVADIVGSEPTIASLTESGSRLYAGGTIYYCDIFGEPNRITFCIWWSPDDLTAEGATYCKNQNDYTPPDKLADVLSSCPSESTE